MKGKMLIVCSIALALAVPGGVPVARTVDVGATIKPIVLEAYAGETLDLAVQLTSGGAALATPAASATLYWQTNGMAGAWWSTNLACTADGRVTGAWMPSLPAGRVWFFAGVESAGLNYRIAGQLTVRPSPGGSPSTATLPPPGGTLNLGDYTVIGAPWITSADAAGAIGAATGPLAEDVAALREQLNAAALAGTNYTDAAAGALAGQIEAIGGRVEAQGVTLGSATNTINARIDGIQIPDVSGFATSAALQAASNSLAAALQAAGGDLAAASNALAQATAQLAQTVADNAQQGGYDLAAVSNALAQAVGSLAQTVAENAQQGGYDLAAVSNALAQAVGSLAQTVADNAQQGDYDLAAVSNALAQATAQLAQTVAENAQQGGYDLAAVSNALAQATAQLAQTVADLAVSTTASNTAYRLATLDGQTYQDATGVVWRAAVVTNLSPWYVTSVYGEQTNAIPGVADWTLTFETNELDAVVGPYAGWFLRFGGILVGGTDYLSDVSPGDVYAQVGVPDGLIDFARTNIVSYGVWLPADRVLYASGGGGGGGGDLTTNDVQGIVAAATQDVARLGQDAYFSNLTVRASEHTYSISVGRTNAVHATALGSLAAGFYNVAATRNAAVALGNHAQSTNEAAFVWSGQASQPYYGSHGAGTFSVNPAGGAEGIYVGDARLPAVIAATVTNTVPGGVFTAWTITRDGVDVTADVGEPFFNSYDNMWDIAPTLVAGDTPFLQFIDGAADDLRLEYDAVQDYDPSLPMPRYVAVRREVMRNALGLARLSDLPDAKPAARLLLKGADGKTYSLTINASQALVIDEVTE